MIFREITGLDKEIFKDALELLNRTQGRDLFPPQYLDRRIADPLSFVVGAFDGEKILAVGIASVLHELDFYLPFDPEIVSDLSQRVVGSFSTLCVTEALQGKGIGQKLSQMRLEWLRERGCGVILGISWVSGLAHTSDRLFEKFGFRYVKKVENFFYKSSIDAPFVCPGCGDPPCTCSAILYRLDLPEED